MGDYAWPNLAAMFFERADTFGDKPFLWAKQGGDYEPLTWNQVKQQVSALGAGLQGLGVEPGDRVVLVSENRPEWLIADIAIMSIGAVTVPAYTTNTIEDHFHILSDSAAKGAVVSTARLASRFLPAAVRAVDTAFVVTIETPKEIPEQNIEIESWQEAIERGSEASEGLADLATRWDADATANIIYTSGTGGTPKGVMLSHRNLFHNVAGAIDALTEIGLEDNVFLSFLPLSHSYEHMAGHFFPMSIGAEIYYAEGIESLGKNMLEARPTIMTAVPRLYEMLYQRITKGVEKSGGLKARMFHKAVELGRKDFASDGRLSPFERLQDGILEKLVRDKVRGRFGGRLKALVSGGAPLNPGIGMFFTALGLRILQGYGQTETAPLVSVNRPMNPKMHTVGPPVLSTEVKIAGDGEILVAGDLVMQGYWRNEEATEKTIIDGWVHTGDVGHLDEDGHLVITDRKKDIIVNSGGDNIAPQRIEGLLMIEPEIAQAMVYGDKRPHLVALLVPDDEWYAGWASDNGKDADLERLAEDEEFHKALHHAIDRVNGELSSIEKVRKFLVVATPFTIDNGQLTPTLKVRRHKIKEIYGDGLEALYD